MYMLTVVISLHVWMTIKNLFLNLVFSFEGNLTTSFVHGLIDSFETNVD